MFDHCLVDAQNPEEGVEGDGHKQMRYNVGQVWATPELPVRSDAEQRGKKNSNSGDLKKLLENIGASAPLNE